MEEACVSFVKKHNLLNQVIQRDGPYGPPCECTCTLDKDEEPEIEILYTDKRYLYIEWKNFFYSYQFNIFTWKFRYSFYFVYDTQKKSFVEEQCFQLPYVQGPKDLMSHGEYEECKNDPSMFSYMERMHRMGEKVEVKERYYVKSFLQDSVKACSGSGTFWFDIPVVFQLNQKFIENLQEGKEEGIFCYLYNRYAVKIQNFQVVLRRFKLGTYIFRMLIQKKSPLRKEICSLYNRKDYKTMFYKLNLYLNDTLAKKAYKMYNTSSLFVRKF